jgi:Concanavalin A-like lectin/glucanases superfamily
VTKSFAARRAAAVGACLLTVVAGSIGLDRPAPAGAAPAVPVAADGSERSALQRAAATGEPAEVLDLRTENSQVFAEPDGHLRLEAGVLPRWVRRDDGSWRDIDLRLRVGDDGRLRPVASVADVAFSADGTGPLASVDHQGHTMTLSWPDGPVPKPLVTGAEAKYSEILPGVDLVVRATVTGFSHVLVVKNAQAASGDAVRHLRLETGGDARIERLADGSLQAVAGQTTVASAGAPAMWDSSTSTGSAASTTARALSAEAVPSTVAEPGDLARVATVGTAVQGRDLVLTPDKAFLAAKPTYPVYIDPAWDPGKNRWAYATSNNSNNTDTSVARMGADPESGKKYRSFFEFKISTVAKSHIESAYVHMGLHHSWSCTSTYAYLYQSGAVSATPRTSWSTKLVKRLAATAQHAHKSSTGTCEDDPQPDADMNFRADAITSLVQAQAKVSASTMTFGFCACSDTGGANESDKTKWKKFTPGAAKLIIDYDHVPGTPTSLQVGLPGSGVGCGKSVGTLTPKLYAVFPDADKGQTIRGTWQWGPFAKDTDAAPSSTKTLTGTSVTAGTGKWNDNALPTLTKNVTYGFRVQGKDPAPYDQSSSFSGWCKFKVDTSVPNVSVTVLSAPPGPGQAGSFRIDSTSADVTKFSYGFTDAVVKDVKPAARTGGGFTATVKATATDYGTNTLLVKATDATLNEGHGQAQFDVAEPTRPVARWHLETTPSRTPGDALADQEPTAAGDTGLTASGMTWAGDVHLVGGASAHFDGTAAQAVASAPVVTTTSSFSVAAWVRPGDTVAGTAQTVIGKDAVTGQWGSFRLQLRGGAAPTWCMLMSSTPTHWDNVAACAPASTRAGTWVHVAGSYDQPSGTVRVYVDGVASAPVTVTAPQNSTGPIAVGRGYNNGAGAEWFRGEITDTQVYDRVLVPEDFTGRLPADGDSLATAKPGMFPVVPVGAWTFDGVHHCPSAESPYCATDDLSQWARRQLLSPGAEGMLQGNRGGALALDETDYDADEDNPDPPKTVEYGRSQLNDHPGADDGTWQDAPVLVCAQSFTVSAWVAPNDTATTMTAVSQGGARRASFTLGLRSYGSGDTAQERWSFTVSGADDPGAAVADAASSEPVTDDEIGSWTHLVGVFDASAGKLALYVNGEPAGTAKVAATWNATGPLVVGAARNDAAYGDFWHGGIDDLDVFQGNMNAAQVVQLYDSQRQPDDAA